MDNDLKSKKTSVLNFSVVLPKAKKENSISYSRIHVLLLQLLDRVKVAVLTLPGTGKTQHHQHYSQTRSEALTMRCVCEASAAGDPLSLFPLSRAAHLYTQLP